MENNLRQFGLSKIFPDDPLQEAIDEYIYDKIVDIIMEHKHEPQPEGGLSDLLK